MVLNVNPARPFGALLTAMVTPFDDAGKVDIEAARRLATWLVDRGCDGILVNGTTGEAPTTDDAEKAELVGAVVDAVGKRVAVLAGAGSNHTGHAERMAREAVAAGADGILVVTPYYSRPSQAGVVAHIQTVAEAGGVPTMIYDVPSRTGVRVSPEAYGQLAEHPLIVATKDASGDVAAAITLAASTGLIWYSGDDSMLLPFLAVGGAGVISVAAHAVAPQFAQVFAAWDAQEPARALEIFRSVVPAIKAINGAGMQAVMAKAAVQLLGVLPNRDVRAPLTPATEQEVADLKLGLEAAHVLPQI
ncbi:MAG: 4-hydroxy-tetrahydrodipicolinate synthase [Promicromonosporaceae bacterium]|nr:4-hydroxy-tetrahydrodipicolinate synthase [Promicromonosporaceae bacterium]